MDLVVRVDEILFLFMENKKPQTRKLLHCSMCMYNAIIIATESGDPEKLLMFCFCNFHQPFS